MADEPGGSMTPASFEELGPERRPGRGDVPPVPGEPGGGGSRAGASSSPTTCPARQAPAGRAAPHRPRRQPHPPRPAAPRPPPQPRAAAAPVVLDGETPQPLRGAAARIVANMEASLEVPTATSVRTVPAKLLEVNRQILNNHLARTARRQGQRSRT